MIDYTSLPEKDLVERLQNGDKQAGGELYERYHERVERFCQYLTGDRSVAGDTTSDAFLTMLAEAGQLKDPCAFRGWLFRIARNNCLMAMRRSSRLVNLDEAIEIWEETSPLTETLQGELRTIVLESVQRLKPIYREAIVLREFDSLTYQEIADITESSLATVKFRIHKARQALVGILTKNLDEREDQ